MYFLCYIYVVITSFSHLATSWKGQTIHRIITKSVDRFASNSNSELKLDNESKITNYVALLSVPLLWGTYSPLVKKLYTFDSAPPSLIFNLLSYMTSFGALSFFQGSVPGIIKNATNTYAFIPGAELGLWLFLGSTLQVIGIQDTSASKAGLIVQSTTIIVPVLESIINKVVLPKRLWISVFIGLVGVLLVATDNPVELLSVTNLFGRGETFILLSAIFYSIHVVRVGRLSQIFSPLDLGFYKSFSECILCIVAIITSYLAGKGQAYDKYFVENIINLKFTDDQFFVYGFIAWNGLITTAYTTWAQNYGQSRISPTQANLIFSMQPLWASFFSYTLLGDKPGITTVVGSLILLVAVILASNVSSIADKSDKA